MWGYAAPGKVTWVTRVRCWGYGGGRGAVLRYFSVCALTEQRIFHFRKAKQPSITYVSRNAMSYQIWGLGSLQMTLRGCRCSWLAGRQRLGRWEEKEREDGVTGLLRQRESPGSPTLISCRGLHKRNRSAIMLIRLHDPRLMNIFEGEKVGWDSQPLWMLMENFRVVLLMTSLHVM